MTTINYFKNGSVDFANTSELVVSAVTWTVILVAFAMACCVVFYVRWEGQAGAWTPTREWTVLWLAVSGLIACITGSWMMEHRK